MQGNRESKQHLHDKVAGSGERGLAGEIGEGIARGGQCLRKGQWVRNFWGQDGRRAFKNRDI